MSKNPTHSSTPNLTEHCLPVLHGNYRPHKRVLQDVGAEPSATKQEFARECDINHILAKFQKTGALSHFAKYSPEYGDYTALDYQTAQNTLINAQKLYNSLPSSIRDLTKSPEGFLAFVQDPANKARMEELGLTATPPAPKRPEPATGSPTPPPAT